MASIADAKGLRLSARHPLMPRGLAPGETSRRGFPRSPSCGLPRKPAPYRRPREGTFPKRASSPSRTSPNPGSWPFFGHLDEGEWGSSSASRVSCQGVIMFGLFRRRTTIIAEGLKIVGSVTAEGLVEVNGHIEGDLHCTSLVISPKASIVGGVEADRIVVNGRVEGPIRGGEVVLKAHAHVVGDIQHQTLAVEFGRLFRRALGARAGNQCAADREVRRQAAERARGRRARVRLRLCGLSGIGISGAGAPQRAPSLPLMGRESRSSLSATGGVEGSAIWSPPPRLRLLAKSDLPTRGRYAKRSAPCSRSPLAGSARAVSRVEGGQTQSGVTRKDSPLTLSAVRLARTALK